MEDLQTYKALGMTRRCLTTLFRTEGLLIVGGGAALGLLLGVGLCLLQEHFGLITLGSGSYIVEAYPVQLIAGDVLLVLAAVLLIGWGASSFPVHYLIKKLVPDTYKTVKKEKNT